MDFGKFDTVSAGDKARPLHLRHPASGQPLMDGETPCVIMVLGCEGREVQAAQRAVEADMMAETDIGVQERLVRRAIPLVAEIKSGIDRGDKPAKAPDDVDWLLNLNAVNGAHPGLSFVEQVIDFSRRRESILGNGSGG